MPFADVAEAEAFLAAHPEVRSIEAFLIDANGVPRGKLLHREELLAAYRNGRPLPASILGLTINGEDVPETGLVWDVGDADCWTFPLASSLTLQPWRTKPTGQVQLAMHPEKGLPAAVADPRRVLQRVIAELAADGLHPVMAVELEFYLLDSARDAAGRPQPARLGNGSRPDAPQVYGVLELEQLQPFFDDLYDACEVQRLPVRTAISEYAPGQLEITLEHRSDALQAIDEGVRYKRLVKGVAAKHGLQACFMAKPFGDLPGSGLHMHVSLADAQGNNLYASEDPTGTPLLRHSIAGMMDRMRESLALFCPTANSFRRFQANSYAPLALTWGVNNRTVSLRVPAGPPESRHVEHRIAGADANLYLTVAAVLSGIGKGLAERIDPGAPVTGNGYALAQPRVFPATWHEAIERAAASEFLHTALGEGLMKILLAVKRQECERFMAEVTPLDYAWYLRDS